MNSAQRETENSNNLSVYFQRANRFVNRVAFVPRLLLDGIQPDPTGRVLLNSP